MKQILIEKPCCYTADDYGMECDVDIIVSSKWGSFRNSRFFILEFRKRQSFSGCTPPAAGGVPYKWGCVPYKWGRLIHGKT